MLNELKGSIKRNFMEPNSVGTAVRRKEGLDKLTGSAKYIDDMDFPHMIYGITIRSPKARGAIKNIHYSPDMDWSQFTIVKACDIPGKNHVALILEDQPFLADHFVNHPEEPVLLLAHPDKGHLELARKKIKIEIDEKTPVFDINESESLKEKIWNQDNVFKSFCIKKGSTESVWDSADHIIENSYETGAQEQLYIETNGVIAKASDADGVTVWGSLQCPYYVHKALIPLFGLPPDKIRVIQTETGGGFGGKEEYPSMLAGHAALLALKSGKPVKMIYDRAEDMVATTKRHPSKTKIKTAFSNDGKLLASEIDFVIDGGAYATLSSVVLSRGTIHAPGPYRCDHVTVNSKAVATNTPPSGAFRGFGAPQSIFAMERHMDMAAKKLGLSPVEIRRKNLLKQNDTTATEQLMKTDPMLDQVLDKALTESGYFDKQKSFQKENPKNSIKKGMGIATFMHGAGFTGSGEKFLNSLVSLEFKEGKFHVLASSTEIGQGTNTVFCQIASDALGVSYHDVVVDQPDTAKVPNSGPTVASRTCMIVGNLLKKAAQDLKQRVGEHCGNNNPITFIESCEQTLKDKGELKVTSRYQQPQGINWNDEHYRGEAYGTYAWAAYVAEVWVDTVTYQTHVKDFVAVQEVGKVIHPKLATGQIEGGVAQAIGYAIYEKVVWNQGRMINNQMTNYIMPTSTDLPPIRVYFLESPYDHGPHGAKGIGELPMDGPAPAILNAIEDATGVSFNRIPLLPEDLMEGLCKV
jgi:CO/xanthine dehydrogenase Mo-binding subunit